MSSGTVTLKGYNKIMRQTAFTLVINANCREIYPRDKMASALRRIRQEYPYSRHKHLEGC